MTNIKQKNGKFTLFLIIFLSALIASSALARKPRMAVAEFKNKTSLQWWNSSVARDLASMLSNELSSSGKFRMVERKKLGYVMREQELAASGRVRQGTRAKTGKLTGAKYLVIATLTSFTQNTESSGGGFSFKGITLGGKNKKAYVAIDLRVVNTTTGDIVHSRTIEGKSKSGGMSLGLNRGRFSGEFDSKKKTPAGKAIRAGVIHIAEYLECVMVDRDGCVSNFRGKERKRRNKTKSVLELD